MYSIRTSCLARRGRLLAAGQIKTSLPRPPLRLPIVQLVSQSKTSWPSSRSPGKKKQQQQQQARRLHPFSSMPASFSSSSESPASSSTHHRRRSSSHIRPLNLAPSSLSASKGASKAPGLLPAHSLTPIPGTPSAAGHSPMSLSRSPSPRPGGGWSSPGLTTVTAGSSGSSSPRRGYGELSSNGQVYSNGGLDGDHDSHNASWMAAKAKSDRVKGYPSFSTRNNGFFSRQRRKISASLPRFRLNSMLDYGEKEKLGRGRWSGPNGTIYESYRRSSIGGGKKIVLIVASNVGGGVMEWKGAREWAIERDSLRNKKRYVKRWGYDLEIVNMVTKKRYAHEWREGWEKVDVIRSALRKYPKAEWYGFTALDGPTPRYLVGSVLYEQKHMEWEHKEQDSLEHLYTNQPWVRPHVAFIPQRRNELLPTRCCGDGTDPGIHYQRKDRDFLVNMAGCEWGRDCWSEIYNYRELSNYLNRTLWEKFKDALSDQWNRMLGKEVKKKP
ncbi:Bed1p [Nannizzia gypsea CBS 118893]|uniref:Bed1p n=1 Tax=Arthroderma gypseum (strain ATCC MYA-4604 / CBS 118893) TaxID=535722 RepID=E4UVI4_ARTGP|nr:Bed1p [Nannizzia gypsea CBS 118893]EFR02311.1 Bed1p [Nannizzia gypsea CBS 118893]